eukprot:4682-Heterococcus_DN1.PRE.7
MLCELRHIASMPVYTETTFDIRLLSSTGAALCHTRICSQQATNSICCEGSPLAWSAEYTSVLAVISQLQQYRQCTHSCAQVHCAMNTALSNVHVKSVSQDVPAKFDRYQDINRLRTAHCDCTYKKLQNAYGCDTGAREA